jgi:hypothetical protein
MTIVEIVLLILIVVGGVASLFLFLRGLFMRSSQASKPYGVARQEARHEMQVNFLRGGFVLVLTLILLGIYGLTPGQGPASTQDTATPPVAGTAVERAPDQGTRPTTGPSAIRPSATPPTATQPVVIQTTEVVLTATVAPTATTTETPTTASAVVNSPNGLWLREAPGGSQQLELIAHETTLVLLPGRETADDLEWQQVRTPAGNEGWVAVDFLTFQN